jgi:hypothetical protein
VANEPESARLKLERAVEHIDAIEALVDEWLAGDDYAIVRETDAATGLTTARAQVAAGPPARLSVLVGDAAHNMRTALDHVVYWLAERVLGTLTPEVEAGLGFPIIGHANNRGVPIDGAQTFRDRNPELLRGVPTGARDFIEAEQPYRWEAPDGFRYHWLWVVHELDRIDKHRRLATTAAALDIQYVSVPGGVDPRVTFKRAEGLIRDGDELVTYYGHDLGVEVVVERAVVFTEPTLRSTGPASGTLRSALQRVEWIVGMLERLA